MRKTMRLCQKRYIYIYIYIARERERERETREAQGSHLPSVRKENNSHSVDHFPEDHPNQPDSLSPVYIHTHLLRHSLKTPVQLSSPSKPYHGLHVIRLFHELRQLLWQSPSCSPLSLFPLFLQDCRRLSPPQTCRQPHMLFQLTTGQTKD